MHFLLLFLLNDLRFLVFAFSDFFVNELNTFGSKPVSGLKNDQTDNLHFDTDLDRNKELLYFLCEKSFRLDGFLGYQVLVFSVTHAAWILDDRKYRKHFCRHHCTNTNSLCCSYTSVQNVSYFALWFLTQSHIYHKLFFWVHAWILCEHPGYPFC